MTVPPEHQEIRKAIRQKYQAVACSAEGVFNYATGIDSEIT